MSRGEQTPGPGTDDHAGDYARLPDFGAEYFSLADAAMIAALDKSASGNVPEVADESLFDEADSPNLRKALEPLRLRLVDGLARAVEAGQINALVRRRDASTSRLIPERTYIHLQDLKDWLDVHGHTAARFIADIEAESQLDRNDLASQVASDRARFRQGATRLDLPDETDSREVASLKRELAEGRRRIRALEQERDESTAAVMGKRERDTLLKMVIGMAMGGYGYLPDEARSKVPADIASDMKLRKLDLSVDTVLSKLKEAALTVLPKQP